MNKINHIYNGNNRSDDQLLSAFVLHEIYVENNVDFDSVRKHFIEDLGYDDQPFGQRCNAKKKIDRRVARIAAKNYDGALDVLFSKHKDIELDLDSDGTVVSFFFV